MSDQNARFQSLIEEACSAVLDERLEHAGVLLEAALDDNFVPEVAEALAAIDRRRSGEAISRSEIVDKLRAGGADFGRVEPSIKQAAATVEHRVAPDDVDDDIFGASIEVDDSLVSGSFASVGLNISADDIDIFLDEDFDSIASPVLRPASDRLAVTGEASGVESRPITAEHVAPQAAEKSQVGHFRAADDDDDDVDFVVGDDADFVVADDADFVVHDETTFAAEDDDDVDFVVDDEADILASEPSGASPAVPLARSTDAFSPVSDDFPVVADTEAGDEAREVDTSQEAASEAEANARDEETPASGVHNTPIADAPEPAQPESAGTLEIEAPEEIVGRSTSTGATVAVDGVGAERYFAEEQLAQADVAPSSPAQDEFSSEPPSVIVRFDDIGAFDERTNTPTGRSTEPTEDFDVAEIDELAEVAEELDVEAEASPSGGVQLRPQTALQQPTLGEESEEMLAAALESVERAILHDDADDDDAPSDLKTRPVSSPRYSADSPPPPAHRQPSPAEGQSSASDDLDVEIDVGFDPMRDTYEGPPGSGDWATASANPAASVKLNELSAPHLAVRPEVTGDSEAFEEVISFAADSADDEVSKLLADLDEDELDLGGVDLHTPMSPVRAMTAESGAEFVVPAREVVEEPDRNAATPLPESAGVVRHRRESSSRQSTVSTSGEYSTVSPRGAVSGAGQDAELTSDAAPEFERLRDVSGLMKRGDLATALQICDAVLKLDPDNSVANEHKRAATSQLAMLAMSRLEPLSRAPIGRPERAIGMTDLTPKMMFVLTRADGHSTLDDLLDCSGLPRQEAAMVLVSLYEHGLLID